MTTKTLILLITAALNLGLSLIVFSKGRKNLYSKPYATAVLAVAAWSFAHGMYIQSDLDGALSWFYFTYVAGALIASQFFLFTRYFPNDTSPSLGRLQTWALSYGFPALVLVGLSKPGILVKSLTESDAGRHVTLVTPSYVFYSFCYSALMGWGFVNLISQYRQSTGRQKMQIRYVMAGTGIAALFGSYFNLLRPWFGDTSLMWLGPPFSLFMIGFIAYAIIKHRLMDIRLILSRTIVYSLLLAITLVMYTMLILLAQRFFQDRTGYTSSLVIGSLLIALGFEPLKRLFQKATERIFFRGELDAQRLLSGLGETFSTFRDMDFLLRNTANQLTEAFYLEHTVVVALSDAQELSAAASEDFTAFEIPLTLNHPLIKYFTSIPPGHYLKMPPKRETFHLEELSEEHQATELIDPGTRATLYFVMQRDHIEAAVPIFSKDEFAGLILLGPKRSGESFFPTDFQLLEIIAQQAGVAIENGRLYQTLQKQMEELKRSQIQQLIQSAKLASIGELATNVAHEINNPLTSILGFASLLLGDMDDNDPRKKDLKVIESEAMRSRDIVRSLLDFARRRPVKKEPTDLNQLILKTTNLLRHQAELSNISVIEDFQPDLPAIILDADQMKQVFVNLMKNAFDAMPKGGTLTITTHAVPSEGPGLSMVEIRFKDSGSGISKENLQKIFDPFFSTKEEMGTGLGLAVSYGIIERHSGRLEVFSDPGDGAAFVIKLPLKEGVHV